MTLRKPFALMKIRPAGAATHSRENIIFFPTSASSCPEKIANQINGSSIHGWIIALPNSLASAARHSAVVNESQISVIPKRSLHALISAASRRVLDNERNRRIKISSATRNHAQTISLTGHFKGTLKIPADAADCLCAPINANTAASDWLMFHQRTIPRNRTASTVRVFPSATGLFR